MILLNKLLSQEEVIREYAAKKRRKEVFYRCIKQFKKCVIFLDFVLFVKF